MRNAICTGTKEILEIYYSVVFILFLIIPYSYVMIFLKTKLSRDNNMRCRPKIYALLIILFIDLYRLTGGARVQRVFEVGLNNGTLGINCL